MLRVCLLTIAVLASLVAVPWMSLPRRHQKPVYTEEVHRALEARSISIDAALANSSLDGSAGVYLRGHDPHHGHFDRLRIAPQNAFVFDNLGWSGRENWGSVQASGTELRLAPELERCSDGCNSPGVRFSIVPWGVRRYLVEPERMDAFVNAVNLGRAAHLRGGFWAREPKGDVPFEGLPVLPTDAASKLLATPKSGRLLSAKRIDDPESESPPHCTFELRLDAGKTDGVWIGMAFVLSDASSTWTCAVTSVDDASAVAVARCIGRGLEHAEPQGGWRWSTREE